MEETPTCPSSSTAPCALLPEQAERGAHAGADPSCLLAVPRARRFSSGGEEDDFDRSMHKVSQPHLLNEMLKGFVSKNVFICE